MAVMDSSAAIIDVGIDDFITDIYEEDEAAAKRGQFEAEAQRIEDTIIKFVRLEYEEARGAMADHLNRWDRYWQMFFNDFIPDNDDSPYKKINVPLLSRNIKIWHAQLSKETIPDKQKMDFFRVVPRRRGPALEYDPMLAIHAKQSEYAIQQNLIDSDFAMDYKKGLLDLLVTGQMYGLHVWEQEVSLQEMMVPNPAYDPVNPANNVYEAPDGTLQFVEPFVWDCQEVRTYDAPRTRYVDARNVYPSEMDKDNAAECYGVSIYDTTTISELKENSIENGGLLYANLDKIKSSDEQRDVPEVDDSQSIRDYMGPSRRDGYNYGANVPKLRRITRFGRLDKEHLFPKEDVSPEAWSIFCEKFNIDEKKARYVKTWVVELINDNVGIRIQPLPYKKDAIPLTHHRYLVKPGRTLGEGCYKLDEFEERIYNFFRRKGIELTQKVVDPPVALNTQAFDPQWIQMQGNRFTYKPGVIVKMRNTNDVRAGFNPMQWDASPLQEIRAQMAHSNNTINAMTNLPQLKQGIPGEAKSATDANIAAASSDMFTDEVAEDVEIGFLRDLLKWHYSLEQQYRIEPQFVSRLDNTGKDITSVEVPPEVWMHEYAINIVGRRTVGNKAVQQMAFKEAMTTWMDRGVVNEREAYLRHMELLEIPDAEALYKEPEPQGPPPPKTTISGRVDINELPPIHQNIILQDVYPALKELGEGMPMPMQHVHEFPGDVVDGGGSGGGSGGDDPRRNHHAPGEVEKRQRGLKDQEGINRSAGQTFRDPTNSRRAL